MDVSVVFPKWRFDLVSPHDLWDWNLYRRDSSVVSHISPYFRAIRLLASSCFDTFRSLWINIFGDRYRIFRLDGSVWERLLLWKRHLDGVAVSSKTGARELCRRYITSRAHICQPTSRWIMISLLFAKSCHLFVRLLLECVCLYSATRTSPTACICDHL